MKSSQPNPFNIDLVRSNIVRLLDRTSLATTASVNKKMLQTELDIKTQDLVDLLLTTSHVPKEIIDRAKQEYLQEKNKPSEAPSTSWFPSFSRLFSTPKKVETSSNLYRHLLKTFQDALIVQVDINARYASVADTCYRKNGMQYSYDTQVPSDTLKRYVNHLCAADSKEAGRLLATTVATATYQRDEFAKRLDFLALSLIEQGADVKVACENMALTNAVRYNKITLLRALTESKHKNVEIKYYEAALKHALSWEANYPCADVLLENCAKLQASNALGFNCQQSYDESMVKYLFSHGVTLLDLATKSDFFPYMLGKYSDEKNHSRNTYQKYMSILENLAKNTERKLSIQDIVQALFSDAPAITRELTTALKSHPDENAEMITSRLTKLNNDIHSLPSTMKQEIQKRIHIAKTLLFFYKTAEELEHEKKQSMDVKHISRSSKPTQIYTQQI